MGRYQREVKFIETLAKQNYVKESRVEDRFLMDIPWPKQLRGEICRGKKMTDDEKPIVHTIRSLAHSLIRSLVHSRTRSFAHSLIRSLVHSFIRSLDHSFSRSLIYSFIHSLIHSLAHAYIYIIIRSFIFQTLPSVFKIFFYFCSRLT